MMRFELYLSSAADFFAFDAGAYDPFDPRRMDV